MTYVNHREVGVVCTAPHEIVRTQLICRVESCRDQVVCPDLQERPVLGVDEVCLVTFLRVSGVAASSMCEHIILYNRTYIVSTAREHGMHVIICIIV